MGEQGFLVSARVSWDRRIAGRGSIVELTSSRFLSVAWTMTDYDGTTQ